MPYQYVEDAPTADVGFVATGKTLEQCLRAAADATLAVMLGNPESLQPTERRALHVESDAVDLALLKLLEELIYYKDAERTAATFVEIDGDRWALPGDMATVEADGSVRLLGRGSLCINTGGEKVYPEEVESALRTHPAIADAVVLGVPDPTWGEAVAAIVAPAIGHAPPSLDDVREHCRGHLAGYKAPRALRIVDAVSRLPTGKPDYGWARTVLGRSG